MTAWQDSTHANLQGAHGVVMSVESNKLIPWLMVASILSAFACAISIWALILSQQSERESRMLEYYVLEMDAKLIASGVKKPDEAVSKRLEK